MKMNIATNSELKELYEKAKKDVLSKAIKYNEELRDKDKDYRATLPLFLKSNEGYEKAEIKIMLFGQVTNGWLEIKGKDVYVEQAMKDYESCLFGYKKGTFLPGLKKFTNLLPKEKCGKKNSCLWNNIVKMGYATRYFPDKFYDSIVKPHLNSLIIKEIEILKPNYIVLLTKLSKQYGNVLKDIFGEFEIRKHEVILPSEKIPNVKKVLITYNPSARCKKETMRDSYHKIIAEILADE